MLGVVALPERTLLPLPEAIAAVRHLADYAQAQGLAAADEVLTLLLAELHAARA